MVPVLGQFDTRLATPITLWPEVKQADLRPCEFQIGDAKVQLWPLTITPLVDYGEGNFDFPELTEIRIWIAKDTQITESSDGRQIIPTDEDANFEKVLIQAMRRFMTIVKLKIGQPSLETRHPVHTYRASYNREGIPIGSSFSQRSDYWKFPEYTMGMIPFETYPELTTDVWEEITHLVKQPVEMSPHDELLNDAKTFLTNMRYDPAILYAAFASELLVEETCRKLLQLKGDLIERQCDVIIQHCSNQSRIELINELSTLSRVRWKPLDKFFKQRNQIAHSGKRNVTWQEATDAILTALSLRRDLTEMVESVH